MKIMVLAGGNDQAALIQELHRKFEDVEVLLIDMAPKVVAAKYADRHIVESTMDLPKVKEIAQKERVDYIMTACGDQPMLTMAVVSEELGLPCYLSKEQVLNFTNKMYMKRLMVENKIPTSAFKTFTSKEVIDTTGLNYPLVVKPVDSNGSKGVHKVNNREELEKYLPDAFRFTLTDTIIIEEWCEGVEISADFYICDGKAKKVMWCQVNKYEIDDHTRVIYQSIIPPTLSEKASETLMQIADKIVVGYGVDNAPLLVQVMVNGDDVKVIELSARLGGGAKYKTIQHVTGFNVLRANMESMLGEKPEVVITDDGRFYSRCHLYVKGGVFTAIVGLEHLKQHQMIEDYVLTKPYGVTVSSPKSSSDRVASVFVSADSMDALNRKVHEVISSIKVMDENGTDMLFREMYR